MLGEPIELLPDSFRVILTGRGIVSDRKGYLKKADLNAGIGVATGASKAKESHAFQYRMFLPYGLPVVPQENRRIARMGEMRKEFTAIVERDYAWYIACGEGVPGANGQGRSREECLANLREAIALIVEHRQQA